MNRDNVEKWVAALEDPVNEKKQVRGYLTSGYDLCTGKYHEVCALGLTLELMDFGEHKEPETWLGIRTPLVMTSDGECYTVIAANDSMKWSFWEIAQGVRTMYLKEST